MKGNYRAKKNIEDGGHVFFLAGKVYTLEELPPEHFDKTEYKYFFMAEGAEAHLVSEEYIEENFTKAKKVR